MRRGIALALGTASAFLLATASAPAAFHLMKVSEVSAGSGSDSSFVELQMIDGGQNFISGHALTVRDGSGAVVDTFTFPANVANGQNQRTILIADTNGPAADFTWSDLDLGQQLTAGAVCFDDADPADCIAWGLGFSGSTNLPGPDTQAYAGDLPIANSLTRDISRGCNTLLDGPDDRDLGSDYVVGAASPRTNSVAPSETSCPNTQIVKKPKAKTTDRTPLFKFAGGDAYECVLDSEEVACEETFEPGRLKRGKHSIEVTATETDGSIDPTPAAYTWRIVRKR